MANLTGICQYPFMQEDLFPKTGGFVEGRYCETVVNPGGPASCCLPCPVAPWKYGDSAVHGTEAASWLSVCTLPLCVFLLVSYAALHPKWTHRHYLSVCFTLGICCMQLAFIIPLGSKPDECYNEITPKGMHDDLSCAFTGALLLFGGWMVIIWSFIRTVAFHLQVCWEIILGTKFMWGALICGWGVPAVGLTIMLCLTGVSFRFGKVCHINIKNSTEDYWIPVLVFAVAALILQVATMGYCIHVYIRTLFNRDPSTNSEGLPSYAASVRSINARQAYRRIRKVFRLQWRGVAMVFIIIANAILFAAVFITLNDSSKKTPENFKKIFPWLICLAFTKGDKAVCQKLAKGHGPSSTTILAVMILLSLVGLWNFLLFARTTLFLGWVDLYKSRVIQPRKDFVSADARTLLPNSVDARTYEMLYSTNPPTCKSPDDMVRSLTSDRAEGSKSPETAVYGYDATKPPMSFSTPRAPARAATKQGREWDPQSTFAPSQDNRSRGDQ